MSSSSASASCREQVALLVGKDDRYGGFIVDPLSLPADPDAFVSALRISLAHWKSQGKKGIWLKLPPKNANLVPPAIEAGFFYHHAEKDYVMLTFWIPESTLTLPANAAHQVGVGAIVINEDNKILVVKETTGPTRGSGVWKMPTGTVRQRENILDAVTREVREETGIETKFAEILGVRQAHDVAFGKSDLFFLCKLQPSSSDIKIQAKQEIEDAKWLFLEEFRSQQFNRESGLLTTIADIASASMDGKYQGFGGNEKGPYFYQGFGGNEKGSYFYHNIPDISKYLKQDP